MNRLIKTAARYPWAFLAVLLIITLLAASRIGDLRVIISVESMMERGTAVWRLFRELRKIQERIAEMTVFDKSFSFADFISLVKQVLVLSWEHIDRLSRLFPIIAFRLFRNFTGILSSRLAQTDEYKLNSGAG